MSILQHVANDTNAYELWHKLAGMYESIMRKLVRLKYSNGERIVVHTSTFMGLVNQLTPTKMPLYDELQNLLLLSSLPNSWENLAMLLRKLLSRGQVVLRGCKD